MIEYQMHLNAPSPLNSNGTQEPVTTVTMPPER